MATLKIVEAGEIDASRLKGSWAGAFGHTQFMPSTYQRLAVDGTATGGATWSIRCRTPSPPPPTFLRKAGWSSGVPWGYEVRLPQSFSAGAAGRKNKRPVSAWAAMGVTRIDGRPALGRLRRRHPDPRRRRRPRLLVTRNFDALYSYNAAESYGLAIAVLGDRLRGGPGIQAPWPTDDPPLSRARRRELQQLLDRAGYDVGEPDGKIGQKTRDAIKSVESQIGMRPTGRPGGKVLQALRGGVAPQSVSPDAAQRDPGPLSGKAPLGKALTRIAPGWKRANAPSGPGSRLGSAGMTSGSRLPSAPPGDTRAPTTQHGAHDHPHPSPPSRRRHRAEVMREVEKVLGWFRRRGVPFETETDLVGGAAFDAHGAAITDAAMARAQAADAVLFGAVGGPRWAEVPYDARPEAGLLRLRKDLRLFANLRPAICYPALADASSLKRELVEGLDIVIVASSRAASIRRAEGDRRPGGRVEARRRHPGLHGRGDRAHRPRRLRPRRKAPGQGVVGREAQRHEDGRPVEAGRVARRRRRVPADRAGARARRQLRHAARCAARSSTT
jgi:hypothetical protein